MITLKDVRIEKERTYFFFDEFMWESLQWFLDANGVKDYKAMGPKQTKKELADKIKIPIPRKFSLMPKSGGEPACLISNLNPKDMKKIIKRLHQMTDPDQLAWIEKNLAEDSREYSMYCESKSQD